MSDDDKITRLPVLYRGAPADRTLLLPYEVGHHDKCMHERFMVDGSKAQVTCRDCGERFDPMWVLVKLTNRDGMFERAHKQYAEEMKRLAERERTKCQHCGQMTRISR